LQYEVQGLFCEVLKIYNIGKGHRAKKKVMRGKPSPVSDPKKKEKGRPPPKEEWSQNAIGGEVIHRFRVRRCYRG